MTLIRTASALSRRDFAKLGCAGAASFIGSDAKAMEPLTLLFLALAGGGAAALTIAAIARQSAWQDRAPGDLAKLPPFGQAQEITPEHRDDRIELSDGGRVTCRDGTLRSVAPGATASGPNSDLTISEALLCGDRAPYTDERRAAPIPDADLSRRRLEDLGRVWETPMLRLRYTRAMFDVRGNQRLLISSVPRVCPSIELLTLCSPEGKRWRPIARLAAERWTLRGAKDFP